jgi:ribosomal protein S12 methylthiotransferase accessory factor
MQAGPFELRNEHTMMQAATLPEHPRLHIGVCSFDSDSELIVRTVEEAIRVPACHRATVEKLLPQLDGAHSLADLLSQESALSGLFFLGLLAWLARSHALSDGPLHSRTPDSSFKRLEGLVFRLLHDGALAHALGTELASLGSTVEFSADSNQNSIAIACPDTVDLRGLEQLNEQASQTRTTWLPILPFGDAVVVGPVFTGGTAPCLHCFELRWLGLSPCIELERAYLRHTRSSPLPVVTAENAKLYASSVVDTIVRRLCEDQARSCRIALVSPEFEQIRETVLEPHPHCSCCSKHGARKKERLSAGTWDDLPKSLSKIGRDLDGVVGLPCGLAVTSSRIAGMRAGGGLPHVAVCRFAFPEPAAITGMQDNWSHAAADDPYDARTLAIVEALERYSGLMPPKSSLWGTFSRLRSTALLPTDLPLFSAHEYAQPGFPFEPFDPQRRIRWNWGYNITERRAVLVPTSAAWYGYDDSLLGECSSGIAAHTSRACALANGVLELVERDAFMLHWLHKISPVKLDPDEADPRSRHVLDSVQEKGYTVHVLDLTTDLRIPVYLAMGTRSDRLRPALILGAGSALSRLEALQKAINELYSATLSAGDLWKLGPAFHPDSVARLADHSRAYEHPDWLTHASFLWASDKHIAWPSPPRARQTEQQLPVLIAQLREHRLPVIGVELTPPDVARYGVHVVRAIVPGLQPLALGNRRRLGGRRVFEAPRRMGLSNVASRAEALNPMPHCFP